MIQDDVYAAITARIKLVGEALDDATQAMIYNSRPELKMAIRDMGFHVFEMHQFLMRLAENGADLTR